MAAAHAAIKRSMTIKAPRRESTGAEFEPMGVETLPPLVERLRAGELSRHVVGAAGTIIQKRFVVLSKSGVALGMTVGDVLMYEIALLEIIGVQTQGEIADAINASRAAFNGRQSWPGQLSSKASIIEADSNHEPNHFFIIHTKPDGAESGRKTKLIAESEEEKNAWVAAIREQVALAHSSELTRSDGSWTGTQRRKVKEIMTSDRSFYLASKCMHYDTRYPI